ncbi:carboxypeptidase-like regulatory domain-containing protein [Dehalogenimonas etheniformans]|uniref:Carboxypeptidase regulatory-like domain-containing protein n=1 Tax=Dehalogenimonas etheniformans TaxID=1536648 RepID=A0A2P5P6W4_9CHLR|nr:carboxypeptidase-like regulatory domain-containing protein [Dehalogenimonas etheniformans]PPD58038.1 carboxypeptidase regulatory-like domain-containing protein [Dehalogenimonas etheniformans]QNT75388.1 carboxypeptidase regulatory-like domain-containing protein [Dehalogenimonas etheniformans]
MKKIVIALTAILLALFPLACAQGPTIPDKVDFKITVTGKSNAPLEGAKVASESQPGGQLKLTGLTDSNGNVIFAGIKVGAYKFYISLFDYEQAEVSFIITTINNKLTVKMTPVAGAPTTT